MRLAAPALSFHDPDKPVAGWEVFRADVPKTMPEAHGKDWSDLLRRQKEPHVRHLPRP